MTETAEGVPAITQPDSSACWLNHMGLCMQPVPALHSLAAADFGPDVFAPLQPHEQWEATVS